MKVNILKSRNIKVERNHILRLKPGAFHGLENLEILNLRGNLLKGVENTAFTGNHYFHQLLAKVPEVARRIKKIFKKSSIF